MPSAIVYRGLPGSGKSTAAREWVAVDPATRARVNRDDLRVMLHHHAYCGSATEEQVTDARDAIITALLGRGIDIVVDETNLVDSHLSSLLAVLGGSARDGDVTITIEDRFLEVSVDECVRRDATRAYPVGQDVIRKMAADFVEQERASR